MDRGQRRSARRGLGFLVWVAAGFAAPWLAAGAGSADEVAAQVTSVIGESVVSGREPVQQSASVAEQGDLSTGGDGKCSLLVDDDAVLEVCENTSLALERDPRGHRVVRLDAGSIRLVAEPRPSDARIEVHTPAAIATLLGTIVHVDVEPATGRTTVTSAHSRVRVQSSDPNVPGATTVGALERLSVDPGKPPPPRSVPIREEQLADLHGCLVDFRHGALDHDRDDWQVEVLDRIADFDGSHGPFPAEIDAAGDDLPPAGDDLTSPEGPCIAIDCSEIPQSRQFNPTN